jgi:hypothetical protein
VFVLPQSLLLHGGLALADPEYGAAFHRLVEEAGPELDGRNLLVLLLLLERCRGPASLWAPYVSFLPEQYGGRGAGGGANAEWGRIVDRFRSSSPRRRSVDQQVSLSAQYAGVLPSRRIG